MQEPLRVGIAGLGTVGASVVRMLRTNSASIALKAGRPVEVVAVSARDRARDRGFRLEGIEWFDDPVALAHSNAIDLFVELIGGEDGVARASVRAALGSGRSVVTANKALLAAHGLELAGLAERGGGTLSFEAAVAGGIPVVKTLREALAGNRIDRVYGILNGTCNYILTRMEAEGLTFGACLKAAQELGYAEADPTFDVEGWDTAHKLAILTSVAFGTEIDRESIFVEGIASIEPEDIAAADELGYRIKLLGIAQRTETGIEQRVHPAMVPKDSDIARIAGVTNAVAVEGDFVGCVVLSGPGAGGHATASAVVGDILDVARGLRVAPLGRPIAALEPYVRAQMRTHEGGYYLRLRVPDRPGAFAAIAQRMADHNISLDSIVQRNRPPSSAPRHLCDQAQPVTIITHETTERAIRSALGQIEADGVVVGRAQLIRIENL
ncbi:homoserine dehydrogenase [Propylenella binzhouense]|uniref:Homoserine dehydrogenase n=1 Tax=Propylenella binzhouense TaxID=2555902 RepID=A0A964T527_9HYPH|nr:homoserine dehydrogenase [Propylenella binzhouense]MYZ48504.1 homoserine dehydrogenase [Propylenella binzhouense]